MKKINIIVLTFYSITFILNCSFANTEVCESWKLKMINAKSDLELAIGEEIDLNKTFSKIPRLVNSDLKSIMPKINIGDYKLDVFMKNNNDVTFMNENFNGNILNYESEELIITGSVFDRKYLNSIDSEDMKILSREMGHNKDYIETIKNTSEYQLYYAMFTHKFSKFNCKDLKNWYSNVYTMTNKLEHSLLKSDWFHIDNNNYKLIIGYTNSKNQIEFHYFTKKDSINLLFIYKTPINESEFYNWLMSINEIAIDSYED